MIDWKTALEQAVRERWKEERVFFVAQVKPFLTKQGVDVEGLLEGRQVRPFLESEVPNLPAIQNEREPTNWGLVPSDAKIAKPYAKYFEKSLQPRHTEFPFQNALRIAFTRPIADGEKRWLSVNPARFVDLAADAEPGGSFEIQKTDLGAGVPVDQLAARIEQYLRAIGLDPNNFRPGQARAVAMPKGRSALHQLLDLIPPEDLARVSMPLDLVHRLLDRSDDLNR